MAATVAVGVNALSISVEARWRLRGRACGKHALSGHAAVITPAWVWFLREEQSLERGQDRPPGGMRNVVGGLVTLTGMALVAAGFRKLGQGALVNADVFSDSPREWQTGGLYAYVSDPIYLGYGLNLVGRAVSRRSPEMLVVSVWLSALLLVVEVPAERLAHRWQAQQGPRAA